MRTIKEALVDGSLSLEDEIDYADMTEEEYKQEIERLNNIIKEARNYVDKMSYADIVDNPKKDLVKILKKEN